MSALLARAGRAEWTRIWSLRSSWAFVAGIALAVLGPATLLALDAADDPGVAAEGHTAWDGAMFTTMFALFGVVAMSAVLGTSDYGSGGIVPTLQWTPRRGALLTARTSVVVGTTTAVGALLVSAAAVLVRMVAGLPLPLDDGLRAVGSVAYILACGALLGLGLASRSTAASLVSAIALMLVLPLVLAQLPYDWAVTVAGHLPGAGALFLIFGEGPLDDMSPIAARVTLAAWAVAALLAGGWRLLRTDATR